MTMLNAHTATRSFRELQYDLKVFLDGLDQISPIGSPQGVSLVELKWADGSVDIVPSSEFITGLVSHLFPKITIGGKATLYSDSKDVSIQNGKYHQYYLNLRITGAGVQAHIAEFGDGTESIVINGGSIQTLTADTLTLATGVRIGKMQIGGSVHADYCIMNGEIVVEDTLNLNDSSLFKNLRLKRVRLESAVRFISRMMPQSRMSSYANIGSSSGDTVFGLYVIKHLMNFEDTYDSSVQAELKKHKAHIFVQIPIPRLTSNYSLVGLSGVTYDYVQTESTSFPDRMDSPFAEDSPASLVTLYPTKSTSNVSAFGTMYLKIVVPNNNDYLIHVSNPTGESIRACNAWMFTQETSGTIASAVSVAVGAAVALANGTTSETTSSRTPGRIVPLSYVVLPPYSCTDFLFKHEIKGGNYCAYMMPTAELESN